MGIYYYLANKTKKEYVHYDDHVKSGPLKWNDAVQMAIVNYIFENRGDDLVLIDDCNGYDEYLLGQYREIDLKNYKFDDDIAKEIKTRINAIYDKK